MNNQSIGLIIFSLIALSAVFAFILVFGGPPNATGDLSGSQKIGTTSFKYRDAFSACASGTQCSDGLPGIPTGRYEEIGNKYECRCQTSDPTFVMWRSAYAPG